MRGKFGSIPPMQLLSSLSKYLVLVVLSCSLLIAWNVINNETGSFNSNVFNGSMNDTNPAGATVWNSMVLNFKLDHQTQTAQVQTEIRKLLADQTKFNQIMQAAGPYIYYIFTQTKARGLPAEIALIPFIESEYNPNDHSNKGATGLWQLMPETAHDLGVKVKYGYDGRRNVVTSTEAALTYFNDLANNFNGDWYLAIAAYNCGQGKIESATKRMGTQSFWKLPLPRETKLYLPKLLAVAAIVQDPEKYGVQLPPISNQPYFTQVNVNKTANLTKVAQATGVSVKTLQKLNPDVKHEIISSKNGAHTLLVPVKVSEKVSENIPVTELAKPIKSRKKLALKKHSIRSHNHLRAHSHKIKTKPLRILNA